MKILVAGDGHSDIHEVAVAEAFRKLGHEVAVFYWSRYLQSPHTLFRLWLRAQNKFVWGPQIGRLNRDLVQRARGFGPDLVLVYRGTHVLPSALAELKRLLPACKLFGYNNDDPMSPGSSSWLWRHFLKGIPLYDVVLGYRKHNLDDFLKAGARRVELLMPWFIPEKDRPVAGGDGKRSSCDVVFVGHYERDHRLQYIKAIVESGIDFRLFGPEWERAPRAQWLERLGKIRAVRGEEYARTLCSARIALCFFSRRNRDTYTRRCFEIPATRTMMLCEFSNDAARLFVDGKEAAFFRNPEEMISRIRTYLGDDRLREAIAEAGYQRVHRDGHDVLSRMRSVLDLVGSG